MGSRRWLGGGGADGRFAPVGPCHSGCVGRAISLSLTDGVFRARMGAAGGRSERLAGNGMCVIGLRALVGRWLERSDRVFLQHLKRDPSQGFMETASQKEIESRLGAERYVESLDVSVGRVRELKG